MAENHPLIVTNRQKIHDSGSIFYKSAFILVLPVQIAEISFTVNFPLFTEILFVLPKNHNNLYRNRI